MDIKGTFVTIFHFSQTNYDTILCMSLSCFFLVDYDERHLEPSVMDNLSEISTKPEHGLRIVVYKNINGEAQYSTLLT